MCGIAGIVKLTGRQTPDKQLLRDMTQSVVHRGPDDAGFLLNQTVGLGMRRLSIIDVVSGKQPIANEDKTIWIVSNGEIYNYKELRRELIQRGHHFRTASDIETILHCYEDDGLDCVKKLRGMFAFAIWDSQQRMLMLARDRVGIKPLYYWLSKDELVFASEIKTLLLYPGIPRRVNLNTVMQHFAYRYSLSPQTVFEGILKLAPGHILTCRSGQVKIEQYWRLPDPPNGSQALGLGEDEAIERLRHTLTECVRSHLMSEVPLGAFLSGGVDSSTVVGLMSTLLTEPVKTYSVGFGVGQPVDELVYARRVADHFHTDHHELECRSGSVELLHDIVWHLEEPILDPACIPTYLVAQLASRDVVVVLTGEGSDETNAGYGKYLSVAREGPVAAFFGTMPLAVRRAVDLALAGCRKGLAGRLRSVNARSLSWESALDEAGYRPYLGITPNDLFDPEVLKAVPLLPETLAQVFRHDLERMPSNVDRLNWLDFHTWLPDDLLLKVDKMTMAHSLEARVPYLDHTYVELTSAIPSKLKVHNGVTKRLFRKAFRDLIPTDIANRPQHGFDVPIQRWFRFELHDFVHDLLLGPSAKQLGLFNTDSVASLIKAFMAGDESLALLIYGLVIFHVWYDVFIANPQTRTSW